MCVWRGGIDNTVGWDAKSNVNLLTLVQLLQKNRGSMYQLLLKKKRATSRPSRHAENVITTLNVFLSSFAQFSWCALRIIFFPNLFFISVLQYHCTVANFTCVWSVEREKDFLESSQKEIQPMLLQHNAFITHNEPFYARTRLLRQCKNGDVIF